MVSEHGFRSDLFFRLNVLRLHMMSLRERRGDIPILAQHFLDILCMEQDQPPKSLAPATIEELMSANWPGNVRELYNVMQRVVVFAHGFEIQPTDVRPQETETAPASGPENADRDGFRQARARAIEAFERNYLLETLRRHNGNITRSARYALQDRRAFGRLVKRYGIDRSSI
jgi:two-component system, NtrC family, response regulator GlrR